MTTTTHRNNRPGEGRRRAAEARLAMRATRQRTSSRPLARLRRRRG